MHKFLKYGMTSLFVFANANSALAKTDYCEFSQRTVEVHLFGETYSLAEDKRGLTAGFNAIFSGLNPGDRFRVILHKGSQSQSFEQCKPECPSKSFLKGLTDTTCSAVVAKRDYRQFKQTITKAVQKALTFAGTEFNIIDHFRSLEKYYVGRQINDVEAFVFNTTVPFDVDLQSKASLDKAFVNIVQNNQLSNVKIPPVKFVNVNQTKALRRLWADLELDGKIGLDFDIEIVTLD